MQLLHLLPLAASVIAFPHLSEEYAEFVKRQIPTLPLSQNEHNSGPIDSLVFDATEQFVDVRPGTTHEYRDPGPNDKRGPCPGLNAAANHGFLPRSGITTLEQTVTGLGAAYGFGPEFAAALSAFAIVFTGDPTRGTWSIGQGYSPGLLGGLLSNPSGISFSHNNYESDASPTRADAYLNNGDAASLILSKFESLYNKAVDGEFTIDILRTHNKEVHDFSVQNNPYFFSAPFAGLVPPIAHHFVINLMSNHSAENKNGFLTQDVLKQFFAISGPDGAHVYNKGKERIPENWYRRPSSNPYGAAAAGADVAILILRYPDVIRVGGNTGTVNSFVGVNPGDLTGGVFDATTLAQGNNAICFALQASQQAVPSVLKGIVSDITGAVNFLAGKLNPVTSSLGCPQLPTYDTSLFNQFPGYKYKPKP
ncbi:Cloroperoxidase [Aulographum hederae CBS 113979]|uniref:Cloroperoxidase n=1 Tax=Aulographum hederae CBS 113979 TaxID=1176131 RepID=A0A6G1H7B0_9PEZI|nr:Cloroperoxidase [Aulographum hederae CBS 113979]